MNYIRAHLSELKDVFKNGFNVSDIFWSLRSVDDHVFVFESQEGGQWTFIGYKPSDLASVSALGSLDEYQNLKSKISSTAIKQSELSQYKDFPPFFNGWVGYCSFESVAINEPKIKSLIESSNSQISQYNDIDLMYFTNVLCYNKITDEVWFFGESIYNDLKTILNGQSNVNDIRAANEVKLVAKSERRARFTKSQFTKIVQKVKDCIFEGDIFQAVVSNYFYQKVEGNIFGIYESLKQTNPSPYMFFMSSNELELAGSAPETLVSVNQKRLVKTFPLAGTRPRGNNKQTDDFLEKELLNDTKELAEHNMLVDLGRNDLGKVCKIGSVKVAEYMKILKYSHVMHIGSVVEGELLDNYHLVDVIANVLPAGTLSGAPKHEAIKLIHSLENLYKDDLNVDKKDFPIFLNRGVFGGAIGYICDTGVMDMCIAIRTAYKKRNYLFARAGAGIVLDSNLESEYSETLHKMNAVLNAINSNVNNKFDNTFKEL